MIASNGAMVVSQVILWILITVLYVAVFLLYRHLGEQFVESQRREDAQGPNLNERVDAVLVTVDGTEHSLTNGRGNVILFASGSCESCTRVKPFIGEFARKTDVATVVAYAGELSAAAAYAKDVSGIAVSDTRSEFARSWKVPGTPYLVAVDSTGVIRRKGSAGSRETVREFFKAAGTGPKSARKRGFASTANAEQ